MIARHRYQDDLMKFKDTDVVKVLTGIRRCGKSSLMSLYKEQLLQQGAPQERVIHLDFNISELAELENAATLEARLNSLMSDDDRYYLLLDEIQEIDGWERVVNSLHAQKRADLYITGSNARILSSELATYLTGRYVTIPVYPLSFEEYFDFAADHLVADISQTRVHPTLLRAAFEDYLAFGGFPLVYTSGFDQEQANRAVRDIYDSILLRDIVQRKKIRNVEMLEKVTRFCLSNVGNLLSGKKVADYFKSQQRSVNPETIYNYLNALTEAFLVGKALRFDLEGKGLLKTNEKYFAGDHSLVNAVLGPSLNRIPGLLENVVYYELLRRGWTVSVGKQGEREIDFVAEHQDERIYVQVCYQIDALQTEEREYAPLRAIKDNYPKYVLSLDALPTENKSGIKRMPLPEFLLSDAW